MTTIVYDGKTLAVDTASYSDGAYEGAVSKVREIETGGEKFLVAMCGDFADFDSFLLKLDGKDCSHDVSSSAFLVINLADPSQYTPYEKGVAMSPPSMEYCNGSGHKIARGALFAGSGPVKAVMAACRHDCNTEYPIDVYELDGKGGYKYSKIEKPA